MPTDGRSEAHTDGRSGRPNSRQPSASSSWTHGIPAGLPCGIPGIGEVIDGAMQHAPQPLRQSIPMSTLSSPSTLSPR